MKVWIAQVKNYESNIQLYHIDESGTIKDLGLTFSPEPYISEISEGIANGSVAPVNFSIEDGRLVPSYTYSIEGKPVDTLVEAYNSKRIGLGIAGIPILELDRFGVSMKNKIDVMAPSVARDNPIRIATRLLENPMINRVGELIFKDSVMTKLTLGQHIVDLGQLSFMNSTIEEIEFNSWLINIGELAFSSCKKLKRIVTPDSLRIIHVAAFLGCESIEEVVLNRGLKAVGAFAFERCTSLRTLSFYNDLQTVSDSILTGCESLKEIRVSEGPLSVDAVRFLGNVSSDSNIQIVRFPT